MKKYKKLYEASNNFTRNATQPLTTDSDLIEVDLRYSKVNNAKWSGLNLSKTDFSHAKMISMEIDESNLQKGIMTYVDFSNSKISNSNFKGSIPYSSNFTNTEIMKNTVTDSCIDDDTISRILNKILREIREYNSEILNPIEFIFVQLCQP